MPPENTPKEPDVATPVDAYDEMSSAFDGLLEPAAPTEGGEPSTAVVEGEAPKEGEEKAEGEAPKEGEVEAEGEPPKEDEGGEEPVEDWKAKYDELAAQRETPTPQAAPAPAAPIQEAAPEIYDEDEKSFLAKYSEEWPDIVKGEALRRRAEYNHLVKHVFTQIAQVYGPLIERGSQAADTVAETSALQEIRMAHNDYDDKMYERVLGWAEGLTGTRKRIAQEVIESGEPQEVVDLITEFKSATGVKPRAVAGGAPAASPAASKTGLSAKAKQAAQAMSVVDSKRSTLTPAADPTDFDAGWEDAVGGK